MLDEPEILQELNQQIPVHLDILHYENALHALDTTSSYSGPPNRAI